MDGGDSFVDFGGLGRFCRVDMRLLLHEEQEQEKTARLRYQKELLQGKFTLNFRPFLILTS